MKKSYESPLFEEQKFQITDVISVVSGDGEGDRETETPFDELL